jgi:hypothetical protein
MYIECLTGNRLSFEEMVVGSVFKFGDSFYILAHKVYDLFNPDDQEDTLVGVNLLRLTKKGFELVEVKDLYDDKLFKPSTSYVIHTVDKIILR